jgi:hypothetical protein
MSTTDQRDLPQHFYEWCAQFIIIIIIFIIITIGIGIGILPNNNPNEVTVCDEVSVGW